MKAMWQCSSRQFQVDHQNGTLLPQYINIHWGKKTSFKGKIAIKIICYNK